eukprot:EG_transcript_12037
MIPSEVLIGTLAEHFHSKNVLSVYLPASPSRPSGVVVDALDLLHWAVRHAPAGFNQRNISEFFATFACLPLPTVEDGFGKRGRPVAASAMVLDALPQFSANVGYIAPVQDPSTSNIVCTTSITCILRMLQAEIQEGHLRMLGHVPVQRLLPAAAPPVVVKGTDTVLAAMNKLHTSRTRYSAAAVVSSETGMFEGCFSARDLAAVYTGAVSAMTRVAQFTKAHSGQACVCTPSTSLQELISDLVGNGRHHAFVVDNHYAPAACLSAADIIALISEPSIFGSPAVCPAPALPQQAPPLLTAGTSPPSPCPPLPCPLDPLPPPRDIPAHYRGLPTSCWPTSHREDGRSTTILSPVEGGPSG